MLLDGGDPQIIFVKGDSMNREEILNKIEKLLHQHNDGIRGSVHQEPYKGDLFKLFAAAFNGGLIDSTSNPDYLSTDALRVALASRSPELLNHDSWHNFYKFWSDWTYAWQHVNLLSRSKNE